MHSRPQRPELAPRARGWLAGVLPLAQQPKGKCLRLVRQPHSPNVVHKLGQLEQQGCRGREGCVPRMAVLRARLCVGRGQLRSRGQVSSRGLRQGLRACAPVLCLLLLLLLLAWQRRPRQRQVPVAVVLLLWLLLLWLLLRLLLLLWLLLRLLLRLWLLLRLLLL